MQIISNSKDYIHQYSEKFSGLLTKIFSKDINVCSEIDEITESKKFYFFLNNDKSLKFILPYYGNSHLLSYLLPTRLPSKIILVALKILYRLRILRFLNNVFVFSITGFDDVNWQKYGWPQRNPPNLFILIGTPKESQNAIVFLDDEKEPKNSLILKFSINNVCNLKNEYISGRAIASNPTSYIVFNDEERYLTQKCATGYRKIAELNNHHVDFLSGLIVSGNKKSGNHVKAHLQRGVATLDKNHANYASLMQQLIEPIRDSALFLEAHVHGDFSPFNIIYSQYPDKFSVIDWENADLNRLALSDLFNYVYIKDCLFIRKGSLDLDSFIYTMAQKYFLNVGHDITALEFYEYKIISVVTEFTARLQDAGTEDMYVRYLYGIMQNENKKNNLKFS